MLKNNRWVHGPRQFVFEPLPPDQVGRVGCRFLEMTFDPEVGDEVFVLFMDEPGYAEQFASVAPLTLLATSGLIPTPFAIIPYIVWTVAAGSPQETQIEHFLNPHERGTLRLLRAAAEQTHLKLVIINNQTSEVCAFVDYQNSFGIGGLATAISAVPDTPSDQFLRGVEYVKANVPTSQLMGKSSE